VHNSETRPPTAEHTGSPRQRPTPEAVPYAASDANGAALSASRRLTQARPRVCQPAMPTCARAHRQRARSTRPADASTATAHADAQRWTECQRSLRCILLPQRPADDIQRQTKHAEGHTPLSEGSAIDCESMVRYAHHFARTLVVELDKCQQLRTNSGKLRSIAKVL
jgi:hypothetical protein